MRRLALVVLLAVAPLLHAEVPAWTDEPIELVRLIERASRAEASAPEGTEPMMTLVRVAETDAAHHHEFRARRDEVLRRLENARCIVRRFGLTGLGRRNGDITIVAAVVACIADLEHGPTVGSVRAHIYYQYTLLYILSIHSIIYIINTSYIINIHYIIYTMNIIIITIRQE